MSSTAITTTTLTSPTANSSSSTGSPAEFSVSGDMLSTMETPFSPINLKFNEARTESDEHETWSFHKGDIRIDTFSAAVTGFLTIFDALGSPIITEIVRKDFRWKTNGLRNSAKRLRADSLRDLVRKELKSPPRFWAPSGIESLLWSHRILQFVEQLVRRMAEDTALELKEACVRAYRATLAVRHPQMTRIVFERALALVPPREQFIANLSQHESATEEDHRIALVGMNDFLRSTRPHIEALRTLFDMEEIEDPHR